MIPVNPASPMPSPKPSKKCLMRYPVHQLYCQHYCEPCNQICCKICLEVHLQDTRKAHHILEKQEAQKFLSKSSDTKIIQLAARKRILKENFDKLSNFLFENENSVIGRMNLINEYFTGLHEKELKVQINKTVKLLQFLEFATALRIYAKLMTEVKWGFNTAKITTNIQSLSQSYPFYSKLDSQVNLIDQAAALACVAKYPLEDNLNFQDDITSSMKDLINSPGFLSIIEVEKKQKGTNDINGVFYFWI